MLTKYIGMIPCIALYMTLYVTPIVVTLALKLWWSHDLPKAQFIFSQGCMLLHFKLNIAIIIFKHEHVYLEPQT